jgi:molybdenum cofactor biosynthesis enzyme MoaA
MLIWGHEVPVKAHGCALWGEPGLPVEPQVTVYVRLTNNCNLQCPFCTFCADGRDRFDVPKFAKAMHELRDVVRISKVSFTGGEPTVKVDLLNALLWGVRELDPTIFTVVSTNGFDVSGLDLSLVDSVAMSRHHYAKAKSDEMFGLGSRYRGEDLDAQVEHVPKEKLHLTCNLARGYVDSPGEVRHYLDHYSRMGVTDFGFVNLMPVNKWAEEHRLGDEEAMQLLDKVPGTQRVEAWSRGQDCLCNNYETRIGDRTVYSYCRQTLNPSACESVLVFDVDKMKMGFSGPTLIP